MVRAVAEQGAHIRVAAIAITNLNGQPSPPCGACRQVLSEFVTPEAWVVFRAENGWEKRPFSAIFPFQFALRGANK